MPFMTSSQEQCGPCSYSCGACTTEP